MRRIVLVAALLVCLSLATVVGLRLFAPKPGITAESFYRLRIGMTEEEAEAVLGEPGSWDPIPPDTFGSFHRSKGWGTARDLGREGPLIVLYFDTAERGRYVVCFGELMRADGITELPEPEEERVLDHVRRILPWSRGRRRSQPPPLPPLPPP